MAPLPFPFPFPLLVRAGRSRSDSFPSSSSLSSASSHKDPVPSAVIMARISSFSSNLVDACLAVVQDLAVGAG